MIPIFRITLLPIVVHLLLNQSVYSQVDASKYEVGVNAGAFIYQGDLTPSAVGSFRTPAFAFGVNGSRRLHSLLAARLDISSGKLKGDDAKYAHPEWRQQRNFNFTAAVTEVTASLVFTPIGTTHQWNPYLFAGLGLSFLTINRDYSNYNAEYFADETVSEGLASDMDHRLPKVLPIVPLGLGLRYALTQQLSIVPEASYRLLFSDYLDGFSQAANPKLNDHYYKFTIGFHYSLGKKDKLGCPVIRL